jgi:MFS family permease
MITGQSTVITLPLGAMRGVPESRLRPSTRRLPSALRGNRDFTLLWAGQAVSQLGTRIYGVAYMLWVLAVTGSVARTGLISSVSLGAFALAQVPGGWLADRVDRRRTMVACDACSAIAALSLCAAAACGWFNIAHVLLVAVVLGVGWGVRGTAEAVSLQDVVPPEEVAGAAALISARGHAAGLAGPPVASNLFSLSPALPFLLDGISYLVALVCAGSVHKPLQAPSPPQRTGSPRAEILEGMRVFWSLRFVRVAVALDAVAAFASSSLALLVLVVLRDGHASTSSIGLVLAIGSVGGLTGAGLASSLVARLSSPLPVLIAAPAFGSTAVASLAFTNGTAAVALGFGAFFLMWPLWSAVLAAQCLSRVAPEHSGRVGGTAGLLGASAVAAAPVSTGLLLTSFGTQVTCVALAATLAAVALTASVSPALRDAPPARTQRDAEETDQPEHEEHEEHEERAVAPPPPLLLRGPLHESTKPPVCMDFQARVGRPAAGTHGGPRPCVLVMTRTADREIDDLSLRLAAAGIPMLRLDSDRVGAEGILWDPAQRALTTSAGSFRPVVSWLRYFSTGSMPAAADLALAAYQREQWSGWAPILLSAGGVSVVNRSTGPDRVTQLAEARAAGLLIPATVVTNAPWAAAAQLPGSGDVIVKALGEHYIEPRPGHLIGIAPRRVSRTALKQGQTVEPAPVMVQEFLASSRELRIYLVGGELITYAVIKPSPESLWEGDPAVYARSVPTPPELERPLARLAQTWNLDVAAFDLLDTPDGPVFLEVNGACDWLWSEGLAGDHEVSRRVAELISARFDAALAAVEAGTR